MARSLLAVFFLAVGIAASAVRAQDDTSCNFDYVVEGGLIAEKFMVISPMHHEYAALAKNVRREMPNARRMFKVGPYLALVGWSRLHEDHSKLSKLQVREQIREQLEYNMRAVNPEANASYRFAETTPFSTFFTLDYFNKGVPYRDVTVDVLASPRCILSIKFSGSAESEGASLWDLIADELERIRAVVAAKERPFIFSEE